MNVQHWDWIGDLLGLRASLTPEREAIVDLDQGISYTYRQLNERANRLACYLAERVGIKQGDRVAFLARNQVEMFDGLFGCGKVGAIFVPYNLRLSPEELKKLLDREQPRVMFYDPDFSTTVSRLKQAGCGQTAFVALAAGAQEQKQKQKQETSDPLYTDLMATSSADPMRCDSLTLDDIQMLIHTGGTTGLPKGAMISYRAVLFNALNNIIDWRITQSDTAHLLLPLFHTGGWNLLTLALLRVGGRVLINRTFDPGLALRVVNAYRPDMIFGAATIFRMMYEHADFEKTDWSSVRWVMSGAAPTPIQVMEKFWSKGVKFCAGYGLTEGGPMNLAIPVEQMTIEQIKPKYTSVGVPFHFTVARILDDADHELSGEATGELVFAGPQIFSGYWGNEEETRKTLRNGWVHTGDIAYRDGDGFYYIVGRKKNMYISGGENVFPPEIESVLYELEAVFECSVIGVPDNRWGEVGKAVIALRPGKTLTRNAVIAHLKSRLAHYKVPAYVTFVDAVPKNSVGKIVAQDVIKLYGNPSD